MSFFKMEWIDEFFSPKLIMDLGSYDGEDSRKFKEKCPNARVIAIEADESNFLKMIGSIKRLAGIECYRYAICDKDGGILFYPAIGKEKGVGSIHEPAKPVFRFEGIKFGEPIKVPSIRIDTFCKNHNIQKIDLIHLDLQSAEYEALIGLGKLRPKLIFLEAGGSTIYCYKEAKKTDSRLMEMGYKMINKELDGDQLWIYNGE